MYDRNSETPSNQPVCVQYHRHHEPPSSQFLTYPRLGPRPVVGPCPKVCRRSPRRDCAGFPGRAVSRPAVRVSAGPGSRRSTLLCVLVPKSRVKSGKSSGVLTESCYRCDGDDPRRQGQSFYPGCPGDYWLDGWVVESWERRAEGVGSHILFTRVYVYSAREGRVCGYIIQMYWRVVMVCMSVCSSSQLTTSAGREGDEP